jgi:hypothetical protein
VALSPRPSVWDTLLPIPTSVTKLFQSNFSLPGTLVWCPMASALSWAGLVPNPGACSFAWDVYFPRLESSCGHGFIARQTGASRTGQS